MENIIPSKFDKNTKKIINLLKEAYQECKEFYPDSKIYLYGGYLRNLLMNNYPSDDLDLIVSQEICDDIIYYIEQKLNLYKIDKYSLTEYPKKDQEYFQLSLSRLNMKIGIIPLKGTIQQELETKDFTVNNLCYDVIEDKIIDEKIKENFKYDFRQKLLNCIQNERECFSQSPSRVIRCLRFAIQYKFRIKRSIIDYLKTNEYQSDLLRNKSFRTQFLKLLKILKIYPKYVY